MGSIRDRYEYAVIELLYARMQTEILDNTRYDTRIELSNGIFGNFETFPTGGVTLLSRSADMAGPFPYHRMLGESPIAAGVQTFGRHDCCLRSGVDPMPDLIDIGKGFDEILRPHGTAVLSAGSKMEINFPAPLQGSPADPGEWLAILGVVGIAALLITQFVPTWHLLARSLPQHGRRNFTWRALVTLLGLSMRGLQARSLHKAARLRIEIELLNPAPEPPLRLHHRQKAEYRAARKEWKQEKREWKEQVSILLGDLAQEVQEEDAGPAIDVPTCSPLIDNDGIERYFNALHHQLLRPAQKPVFLSKVMIRSGFAAPLHLLTGVLARYDEEWQPIVEGYGRSIIRPGDELRYRQARKIQMFIFDCWLLWGPSIPLCTCPEWHGDVALQYGYGDEDNSLTLRCTSPEVLRGVKGQSGGVAGFAVQTRVCGTLKWGPVLRDSGMCPAQVAIWQDNRLVLDITEEAEGIRASGGTEEQVFAQYYSAYLWIAFVMCDKDGEPLNPNDPDDPDKPDQRWRDIIPFFMHGNIGDSETYDFHTSQLARAVLEGALQLLRAEEGSGLILRFVCAIDESGCGFDILYPMPAEFTIREKIAKFADAAKATESGTALQRLDLDYHKNAPFKDGDYSACGLPGIVDGYYHGVKDDPPTFRELRATRQTDIDLLERFYRDCFEPEFPNPDERENCETIVNYLRLKETGWYGKNNYHVVLAFVDGDPIGGAIADYLDEPNAGVIEYLVIQPEHRGSGIGRGLLEHTERLLHDDADASRGRQLDWIVAELDDPYRTPRRSNGFDPFTRLHVWGSWGYRLLDFPYQQPALGPDKNPVTTLMLTAKTCSTRFDPPHSDREGPKTRSGDQNGHPGDGTQRANSIPSADLETLVREYMHWAMRIEEPAESKDFIKMKKFLQARDSIRLVDFDEYRGWGKDICIKEVKGKNDSELDTAIDLYEKIFKDRVTTSARADFREAFRTEGLAHEKGHCYHLWTISTGADANDANYEGMASFLTTKSGGVCGCLGFIDPAPDPGRLRPLLARIEERMMHALVPRIEERMIRDALGACGWTIACYDETQRSIFSKLGFQEADESQRPSFEQPRVPGEISGSPAGSVHLLYKPFGRKY
jgi:GNAT superfamily N-acetyltransferase